MQVNAVVVTRYRSEETLTRMRSSPTLTFSPSDLCLEAGWMVHQQASPVVDIKILKKKKKKPRSESDGHVEQKCS